MATLQVLFFIAVAIYTIVNLIIYASRRSENKHAFGNLLRHHQPIRSLTPEEAAAVQPFLLNPLRKGKTARLTGEGVYELYGAYMRHGLSTSQGGQTLHDTLGGVDVVLPYDAREHLGVSNRAEVVLTDKFAIVVRLNEGFDLLGGRERSLRRQSTDRQRAAEEGRAGFASASDDATAVPAEVAPARVIEQRDETPAEVAARIEPGLGWPALVFLLPAFALLLVAGHRDQPWPWLVPSIALFVLAFWQIWRPWRSRRPLKVDRVEGGLNLVRLEHPGNSNIAREQWFLGDARPISMPAHWEKWIDIPADGRVELDVRADGSVVRLGEQLSLDREERLAPSVYWGRHALLAGVGVVLLLAALLFGGDSIGRDVEHVRAAVITPDGPPPDSAARLLARPPAAGQFVHIKAQARCRLLPAVGDEPAPPDCANPRWGGTPLAVPPVSAPAELVALSRGDVLHTRFAPSMDAMLQMRMAIDSSGGGMSTLSTVNVLYLENLSEVVLAADRHCTSRTAELRAACARLRELLVGFVEFGDGVEAAAGSRWAALLVEAKAGRLEGRGTALSTQRLDELRAGLRAVAAAHLHVIYAKPLKTALDSQRGGVVLPLPQVAGDESAQPEEGAEPEETDWPAQWERYRALDRPDRRQRVELEGIVTGLRRDERGELVLEVDPSRRPGNTLGAGVRLLGLALAAALLTVHAALACTMLRRASRRARLIESHLQQQHRSLF